MDDVTNVTNITKFESALPDIKQAWDDQETIHKSYAADLNKSEFRVFRALGIAIGAIPWIREIYGTKIQGKMQTILARDFYRRKGQEQPDYKIHRVYAVYSEDEFVLNTDEVEPKHTMKSFIRGELVGAYMLLWKKGIDKPFYTSIRKDEYLRDSYIWKTKPETMLKKVVEAHGFRQAWQGLFAGTYSEDEHNMIKADDKKVQAQGFDTEPPVLTEPATAEEPPEDYPEVQDEG